MGITLNKEFYEKLIKSDLEALKELPFSCSTEKFHIVSVLNDSVDFYYQPREEECEQENKSLSLVMRIIFSEMNIDNNFIKKSEKHTNEFKEGYAEAIRNLAVIIKEKFDIDVRLIEYEVGTKVKLPFGETGTIQKINTDTLDWFPYKVKIRKAIFNKTNQVLEFKKEQLQPE